MREQTRWSRLRLLYGRECKVKNRPVAGLARHTNLAAMRFHNGFRNSQTHSRALHLETMIASSVELLKNQRLLKIVNPGSAVGDTRDQHSIFCFSSYVNRSSRSGIFGGIFQKMPQNFVDANQVHLRFRKVGRQV